MNHLLPRQLLAEAIGTGLIIAAAIGAGTTMHAIGLNNELATASAASLAAALVFAAASCAFSELSGGHFNPCVSVVAGVMRELRWSHVWAYVLAQLAGAFIAAAAVQLVLGDPLVFVTAHAREGIPLCRSELIATFGLIVILFGTRRLTRAAAPFATSAYIAAVYWFSASPTLGNLAIAIVRVADAPPAQLKLGWLLTVIVAQTLAVSIAAAVVWWLSQSARVYSRSESRGAFDGAHDAQTWHTRNADRARAA